MAVSDIDILKNLLKEDETFRLTFEEDPMGFILNKYPGLNNVMEYMMTKDFKQYVTAIYIVAPKPTTFKVVLHNGQHFFLQFMGKAYQATVLGKNYYLMSEGEKQRGMLAIARLLRYGVPLKTQGPEGGEQGGGEGTEGGGGGETGGGETGGGSEGGAGEEVPEASPEEEPLEEGSIKEGPTNAPGVSTKSKDSTEVDMKSSSQLQSYMQKVGKDAQNFKGLDSTEISAIYKIISTMLSKSAKGSTGATLNAVSNIIKDKTKSITEEETMPLKTYGDLKKLVKTISSGNRKAQIVSTAGNVALDQLLGVFPGASNVKSIYDLVRSATKTPDTNKPNSWLKKLDIDDDTSAIVDDTVENGFLQAVSKEIEKEPDDKELEDDYSMNTKLANYLKAKYKGHFVAPDKLEESIDSKKILLELLKLDLSESRGIPYRQAGDVFTNGKTKLVFQSIEFYPKDSAAYEKQEDMRAEISRIESEYGTKIDFANKEGKNMAFGVAYLKDESGKDVLWGKYADKKDGAGMISWKSDSIPGGFKLDTKSAQKSTMPVKPIDLIKTESPLTVSEIESLVKKNSASDPSLQEALVDALDQLRNGELPTVKGQADNLEAIRDSFGEIIAPIALTQGLVGGDASSAEETLLPGESWADCKISFDMSETTMLYDSAMISGKGVKVKISSKGKKGAPASSSNLWNAIQKSSDDLKKEYAQFVSLLETISEQSSKEGPLVLAKQFKLYPDSLLDEIRGYIDSKKSDVKGISKQAQSMLADNPKIKTDRAGFRTGLALLSIVAKKVAEYVNTSADLKFSAAAKAFLNQESLVQINCFASKVQEDVKITKLVATYPPNFEGTISMDAGKNYSSTEIKGKLSFSIPASA